MRITALVVLLACVACGAQARAQDEERSPSRAGLLKRGLLAKGKATTTTTTQPPQEEPEYEDDVEYAAEESPEASSEAPPSSTEGKKLGGVRPFRSNTDLLETLKRRRQQAAEAKLHGHSASTAAAPVQADAPTEAPVKANFSKKRFTSGSRDSNTEESSPAGKPSRNRFGRPAKSIQEVEPEEQNDAAPPARTGRAFSGRRGGN